jgi:hypothetical protein
MSVPVNAPPQMIPHEDMPSAVTDDVGIFDRFAGYASRLVSRAPFFAFCVLLGSSGRRPSSS